MGHARHRGAHGFATTWGLRDSKALEEVAGWDAKRLCELGDGGHARISFPRLQKSHGVAMHPSSFCERLLGEAGLLSGSP